MDANFFLQCKSIAILKNIFFCVQQKKGIQTGLEQLEGEYGERGAQLKTGLVLTHLF